MSKMLEAGRPCWKPITTSGDGAVTESKFGGIPYIKNGEEWPLCGNCRQPVQLFLQLNGDTVPTIVPFSGLLQFFYCTNTRLECEVESEAWAPHAKSTLLRIVFPEAEHRHVSALPPSASFPPQAIISWEEILDYPHYEDAVALGIDVPDYLVDHIVEAYHPEEGDKLLGWPSWVQGVEYPTCTQCQRQMRTLFQIASEDNVPYMFGDVGTGHISICPNHPEELAFGGRVLRYRRLTPRRS